MGFAETRASGSRRILSAVCPVNITLSEAVQAGDCIAVTGGTWVRAAHTADEEPLLVAAYDAPSGAIIPAYPMAVVEVTTTATNKSTVGEKCALDDTGNYQVQATGLPDVGYSCSIGSDNLTCVMMVWPAVPQIVTIRA